MNKRVIIKSCGQLNILKGVCGPILTPIVLNDDEIYSLLITKKEVYEILKNGKELKLNLDNYDMDNNKNITSSISQKILDVTKK